MKQEPGQKPERRPKKVLFLITKGTWGGAQRYVYDLATNLPREQFEPVVAFGQHGKLVEKLSGAGVRCVEIQGLGRDVAIISDIRSFLSMYALLRAERPDVIHLNSSKAAALGALAARLAGIPHIVFTAHGWPFKEERGVLATWLIYLISWLTALLSHSVIVVSKEDEAIGKRMYVMSKKITYIPLALAPGGEMYARDQAEELLFTGISSPFKNTTRLVTIAELTPNKGIEYSIDMMNILQTRAPGTYSYTIIGKGELGDSLVKKLSELGLIGSVAFANFNASNPPSGLDSEASRYLRAFDIFVLPSIKEGMPYVLLEAATAGLPIVTTDIVRLEASKLPDIHFVRPRDPEALADAVEQAAKHLNMPRHSTMRDSFATMLGATTALY